VLRRASLKGAFMKVLFLIFIFFLFILTVKAERPEKQFTCQVSHKHYEKAFDLETPKMKNFTLGPWELETAISEVKEEIKISLKRVVNIMDATYEKTARKTYPKGRRFLPVTLVHPFGGNHDTFNMNCYSRDP
jgi:hypothetical protein